MSKTIYSYVHKCVNCSASSKFEIPKGETIQQFLEMEVCRVCGCHVDFGSTWPLEMCRHSGTEE